jgi:hypothetical protein
VGYKFALITGASLSGINRAIGWGRKAAQAGLKIIENPYSGGSSRAAWRVGYKQITSAEAEQLERR